MYGQPMNFVRSVARKIPAIRRLQDTRDALLVERDVLRERLSKFEAGQLEWPAEASRFLHYNSSFDPLEVMRRHAVPNLGRRKGYLTNFLGVVIDPKFFPSILNGREGQVEGIPIPANWHADIAEWGAALRAVDFAQHTYTVIELGCGWGCWMINTGVAARRAGLDVHLIGVEAD